METSPKPAHLHSLLSWLIWSVTKLCSREETSAGLTAPSFGSLEEANSMTQWAKAKVKCRSVRVSVWACCGKKQGDSTGYKPYDISSQQFHILWLCLYLHQCIHRELWRVKEQTAIWSRSHAVTMSLTEGTAQEPGWVCNKYSLWVRPFLVVITSLWQPGCKHL